MAVMAVKRNQILNGRSPSSLILPVITSSSSDSSLLLPTHGGGEEVSGKKHSPWPKLRSPASKRATGGGLSLFNNTNKKWRTSCQNMISKQLPMDVVGAVMVWVMVGVGSICTSKILLTEYAVPPLVLTFQQLFLGSCLLRLYLGLTNGVQPLPEDHWEQQQIQQLQQQKQPQNHHHHHPQAPYSVYFDFVLLGLFNALDFLASNTSFSHSAASFVETIKASEPVTTTAIALFFGIDRLRLPEGLSLVVLMAGVFCATLGNVPDNADTNSNSHDGGSDNDMSLETINPELAFHESAKTAVIVMTANICFGLRAKSQKLFRRHPEGKAMNDINLFMRMQQIGAISLLIPVILFEGPGLWTRLVSSITTTTTTTTPLENNNNYHTIWWLSLVNAAAFCTYSLACCYVLSKLSVVQVSGLGCLRRMFAILFTSAVFGVPITVWGGVGIVLCFCGFCSFTHFRSTTMCDDDTTAPQQPPRFNLPTTLNKIPKFLVANNNNNNNNNTISPPPPRRVVPPGTKR